MQHADDHDHTSLHRQQPKSLHTNKDDFEDPTVDDEDLMNLDFDSSEHDYDPLTDGELLEAASAVSTVENSKLNDDSGDDVYDFNDEDATYEICQSLEVEEMIHCTAELSEDLSDWPNESSTENPSFSSSNSFEQNPFKSIPTVSTTSTEHSGAAEKQSSTQPHTSSIQIGPDETTVSAPIPPISRSSFPQPVLARSPIEGLTPSPALKTCFRTGHALHTGRAAFRHNASHKILLEIYARVAVSYREINETGALSGRQIFELADLFHDRPPLLYGVFEGWMGIPLLEDDTAAFLSMHVDGRMRMCRCIARMERDVSRWVLRILSIWECGWDDILHVHGIVCA